MKLPSSLILLSLLLMHSLQGRDPLPPPAIPAPCGVNLKTHNFTPEVLREAYALGFRSVRRGIYWNAAEKDKGKYDFSEWDESMNEARKLGMTVVGILFGGNKLYENDEGIGVVTEAGRKGFANFAAAAAEHYKDHPVLWEIWNEPNTQTFWNKSAKGKGNSDQFAQEYVALVKETTPAILKADPDAFVMAGSVSNYWSKSYEWTEYCFKRGILKTGIHGWSVHPYGMNTPEEFGEGHAITRDLMKKYGGPVLPLLDTERGFSIGKTTGGSHPDEGWSGGEQAGVYQFQAWNFVRQFMIDLLHDVRLVIWYEWDGEEFGLIDKRGPLPVHQAAKVMFEQLDGFAIARRLKASNELDYVLLMENEKGDRKLVAWTAPPPKGTPDEAVEHVVKISVKSPSEGPLQVTNIDGSTGTAPANAGVIELTVSGAPQYVPLPAGTEPGAVESMAPTKTQPKAASAPAAEPVVGATRLDIFKPGTSLEFIKSNFRTRSLTESF